MKIFFLRPHLWNEQISNEFKEIKRLHEPINKPKEIFFKIESFKTGDRTILEASEKGKQ